MFLLDTNVVSDLRRPEYALAGLLAWSSGTAERQYFSAVTVYELELGVARLARRDLTRAKPLRLWLDESVLSTFAGRILPVKATVARVCTALNVPDPRPLADSLIATTAPVHGLTVATHNVRDFAGACAVVFDPWAGDEE